MPQATLHHWKVAETGYTSSTWPEIKGHEWFPGFVSGVVKTVWLADDDTMKRDVTEALIALHRGLNGEKEPILQDFELQVLVGVYPCLVLGGKVFGSRDPDEPLPTRETVTGRPHARNSMVLVYRSTGKDRQMERARHIGTVEYEPCSVTGYVVIKYSIRREWSVGEKLLNAIDPSQIPLPNRPRTAVFARLFYHDAVTRVMAAKPTHSFWKKDREKPGSAPYRLTPVHRIARAFVPLTGYHGDESSFTIGVLPSPFSL